MQPSLENHLARAWPVERWHDVTVLVAVSGGADSIALLRALAALRPASSCGRLIVAHFNHGLRGTESDADQQFVAELALRLGFDGRLGRATDRWAADVSLPEGQPNPASEERSRAARYAFFVETAQNVGARYVATAHTADDQAETVLQRIIRGTGLAGLAGISRARELAPGIALVRPLLAIRRAAAVDYLATIGQSFREDSSNCELHYTRNRLRHDLLPKLAAEYNPRVVDALLRLAEMADQAQEVVDAAAGAIAARTVLSSDPAQVVWDVSRLERAFPYLVHEMLIATWRAQGWPLQAMGYEEWRKLAALALAPVGGAAPAKQMFPGGVMAERVAERLILSRT